jgi:hypothetical protein
MAMKKALAAGDPQAAELVACECVVLAETKDHADWELIGECAKTADGTAKRVLSDAYAEAEDEEDEHLYHSKSWCRELWLNSLGLKAIIHLLRKGWTLKRLSARTKPRRWSGLRDKLTPHYSTGVAMTRTSPRTSRNWDVIIAGAGPAVASAGPLELGFQVPELLIAEGSTCRPV